MADSAKEVSIRPESESPKKSNYNSSSDSDERHAKRQCGADEAKNIKPQKKEKAKKRRKRKARGYILDEAEVDDCDEDGEDSEEGCNDLIDSGSDEESIGAQGIEGNTRRIGLWHKRDGMAFADYLEKKYADQSHLNSTRLCDDDEEASVCIPKEKRMITDKDWRDYEKYLEQRHGNQSALNESEDSDDKTVQHEVQQHSLLPHHRDPKLWMVKCRLGKEKAIALAMLQKFFVYENSDKVLDIKSIVAPESVKGFVYVEAYQQEHVEKLVTLCADLMGRNNIEMVPILEMPEVLRVVKERPDVWKYQWVRPKRGLYKDDIALINFIDETQELLELQLVPRIEYSRRDPGKPYCPRPRPDARRFDLKAVNAMGGEVHYEGDFLRFKGKRYCQQGFLYKTYALTAVDVKGVKPTLAELEKFSDFDAVGFELPNMVFAPPTEHSFTVGDNVEVTTGELINVCGTITKVDDDMITLTPNSDQVVQTAVSVKAAMLKKCFRTGDHITVLTGRHKGESGMILRIDSSRIILLNDNSCEQLEVHANDLTLYKNAAKGVGSVGKFKCGDVVKIGSSEVGVVVRFGQEYLHVLNTSDHVIKCKATSLQKVNETHKVSGLDAHKKQIWNHDTVIVIKGIHTGRSGEIKHLCGFQAFLHSGRYNKNGGFFVCKTKNLRLMNGKDYHNRSSTSSFSFRGRGRGRGQQHRYGRWGNRGSFNPRFHKLLNKDVTVTTGFHKGWVGIVTEVTGEMARVELQQSFETISFKVSDLKLRTEERSPEESSTSGSGNITPPLYEPEGDETGGYKSSYSSKIALPSSDCSANVGSPAYTASPSVTGATPAFSGFGMSPASFCFQTPSYTSVLGVYNSPMSYTSPSISGSETPAHLTSYLDPTHVGWYACGLQVEISTHDHPDLVGQKGYISQLAPSGYCWMYLWREDRIIHIRSKQLAPLAPEPGENFTVIAGDKKDSMGTVVQKSASNDEALDCQIGDELVTLPIENLCKKLPDNFVLRP